MVDVSGDPTIEAAHIWSNTLTLLKRNSTLTAREKGWLEGIVPEGVFGSTIVLCVDNNDTLQAIQGNLNESLLQALHTATGENMFPAFKVVPRSEPQPVSPYPTNASPTLTDFGKEPYGAPEPVIPAVEQQFSVPQQKMNRDPETHLNKSFTFDSFVPGDSNRFARTVALAVAEGSGQDFNPLCIYGGSGLGKTHLLNAIGNYALVKDPGLKVRYVTSEEFTNDFIDALQNTNQSQGQIAEFNRRYRQVDVLLIDDIQFLGGKEATLDQFFHTFNSLHQANKRIVIASDVAPKT